VLYTMKRQVLTSYWRCTLSWDFKWQKLIDWILFFIYEVICTFL
jgi:hypothetical protein